MIILIWKKSMNHIGSIGSIGSHWIHWPTGWLSEMALGPPWLFGLSAPRCSLMTNLLKDIWKAPSGQQNRRSKHIKDRRPCKVISIMMKLEMKYVMNWWVRVVHYMDFGSLRLSWATYHFNFSTKQMLRAHWSGNSCFILHGKCRKRHQFEADSVWWRPWLNATRKMVASTGRNTRNWWKASTSWPMIHHKRNPRTWKSCAMWISSRPDHRTFMVSHAVCPRLWDVMCDRNTATRCKMCISQIQMSGF